MQTTQLAYVQRPVHLYGYLTLNIGLLSIYRMDSPGAASASIEHPSRRTERKAHRELRERVRVRQSERRGLESVHVHAWYAR